MNDANTAGKVGILAAHGYSSVPSAVNSFGKPLWQTETSTIDDAFDGSISNALMWAVNIHEYMTKAGANAWHYWWLQSAGADSGGLTDQFGIPAKRMYALGNYSKFVRPDFYRIGATNDGSVLVSAYKDPVSGKFAIAAINTNTVPMVETFHLKDFTPSVVTPWITSESLSLAPQAGWAISGSSFVYALPARSVVTFVGQVAPGSQPEILSQPQSIRGAAGAGATFSVLALAGSPLSYQWRVNGTNIVGETNATLSLRNLQVADTGNYTVVVNTAAGSVTSNAAFLKVMAVGIVPGYLLREVYRDISGYTISSLTNHLKFRSAPDQTDRVGSIESTGFGTNYGVRLSGFIMAPTSGNYTFYIASDDQSELYLSSDENSSRKARIAFEPQYNNQRDWTGITRRNPASPENRSAAIPLTAGQAYYVEILHKQGGGGEHVAVAWQKPGDPPPVTGEAPISGDYLSYADPALQPPRIASQPPNQTVLLGSTANFAVSALSQSSLSYQWRFNGVDIPNAIQATFSLTNVRQAQAGTYTVVVSNVNGSLTSDAATLSLVIASTTTGFLQREVYRDVPGTSVSSLTNHPKFPNAPDQVNQISSIESKDLGDDYGVRLSGFIKAPASGSYTFYISSDDQSELYLSTDASPANKVRIAENPGWNNSRDWVGTDRRNAASPENRSAAISLTAGQSYYIEVLHKEGSQGDHVEVAWRKPGDAAPANGSSPIGSAYLSYTRLVPYVEPPAITTQPLSQSVVVGTSTSFSVAATGAAPLHYQWRFGGVNINGATNATLTLVNIRSVDGGDYTVLVTNPASALISDAARLSVAKLEQTIAFDAIGAKTFGDAPFPLTAAASSSLPVSFSIVSGPATIAGNTVTIHGAGLVTVRAAQPGNDQYSAAPNVDQSILVNKASQSIVFPTIGSRIFGTSPFTITATANSGLPVGFLVVSGPAALQGNQLTLTNPGIVAVRAFQPGDLNYLPATDVEQSFLVEKAGQAIAFSPISNRSIIDPPFIISATASSGLPVTLTVVDGPASIAASTITLTNLGTVIVRAAQPGNDQYSAAPEVDQSFTVTKAAQAINFTSHPNMTFGDAPFELNASSTSGLPVTFNIISGPATISGSTATSTGVGTVIVRASQSGDANYSAAPDVEQSFSVVGAVVASISQLTFSPQGEFSFVFTGESGRSYNLEVSNDLTVWTVLDTRFNANGTLQFRESTAAGFQQRFYRVIPKP